MKLKVHFFIIFALGLITIAHADTPQPFDKLAQKVLREPNPFAFIKFNSSVNLSTEDFYLQGADGKKATDLQWVPDSFQWVRVSNSKDEAGILIPRARVHSEKHGDFEIALTQVENEITISQKKIPTSLSITSRFEIPPLF